MNSTDHALDTFRAELAKRLFVCALTFELSGRQRQDASARAAKMYSVPPAGRWWPAVGAPLERGVRPQCAAVHSLLDLDTGSPFCPGSEGEPPLAAAACH